MFAFCLLPSTFHLPPSTFHLPPSTFNLLPSVFYLQPSTYSPLPMNISDIEAFGHSSGIYDFMNSKWGWPAVESLHYLALATLLGTVGLFDLRLLGFARDISIAALHRYVPLGVAAYLSNLITGSLFFVSAPDQYAYNP